MEYNKNETIYGVPQGIYYGQNDRVDELNDRIKSRNLPDHPLEPYFDPRPTPTKYALFPMINLRKESNAKIYPQINHTVETNFHPGYRAGPYNYLTNIDRESVLRNQTVAIQRGADQGIYVPSMNSDLYKVQVESTIKEPQPFPDLFKRETYQKTIDPNIQSGKIGGNNLYNHTRTQLRNL